MLVRKVEGTKNDVKDGNTHKENRKVGTKKFSIFLYGPQKAKGYRYYLKDYTACPEDGKKEIFKHLVDERATTGPSRSTRSQIHGRNVGNAEEENKVAGRMNAMNTSNTHSTVDVIFSDGDESLTAKGPADDGSDESIVSSQVAKRVILHGIGRMSKIPPVRFQVALKTGEEAETFTFSRAWTLPRTILKLSAGPLALLNFKYLVRDSDLVTDDFLIGLPVL